jgi:hypothetical protein
VIADMIGNTYRELSDPQAAEWYKQAIGLLRAVSTRPSVRLAFLLWKSGQAEEMRAECARVMDAAVSLLDQPGGESESSAIQRQYREACIASFLLGSYDDAAARAVEGLREGVDDDSGALKAIAEMAGGLSAGDLSRFAAGVAGIRRSVKEWPNAVSDERADFLRYALWLQEHASQAS